MSVIRSKAEDACAASSPLKTIDPATIFLIIKVIVELIRLWKDCSNTPSQAVAFRKKHGILANIKLRRVINKVVIQHATTPRQETKDAIELGLSTISKKLLVREMAAMFAEAESTPAELYAGLSGA
mgnify:CR=1 FL=1